MLMAELENSSFQDRKHSATSCAPEDIALCKLFKVSNNQHEGGIKKS